MTKSIIPKEVSKESENIKEFYQEHKSETGKPYKKESLDDLVKKFQQTHSIKQTS